MFRFSLARVPAALLLVLLASGNAAAQTPPSEPAAAPELPIPETPPVRVLPTGGLRVESAALLVSGQRGGSIHVAVLALPFPGDAGNPRRARVAILLEIDGTSLLEGQTGDLLRFEVCLYALSDNDSVQGSLLETVEVDLARRGDEVARSGVRYLADLDLPAGEYSLRALVRNSLTGEVGLRILPLSVPERPQGLSALLLPPVFPNPAPDAWVEARSAARPEPGSPAALAGGGLPAAQPVLGIGQEASFELRAYGVGQLRELEVEILRPDGARVIQLPARIEERQARQGNAGVERLTATFVPTGIEAGRYVIRAVLPKVQGLAFAAPSDTLSYAAPFVLLTDGGGGKVWAQLLGGSPRAAAAPAAGRQGSGGAEAPRKRQPRFKAEPVRGAYRQALQLLAAGDGPAARRAVAELEGPLARGGSGSEDLAEVELEVARDLTAAGPRSLIPVILLHEALYREAQARRDRLLSTHARELTFRLIELYAERSGDPAGRKTAARLLLALAADLIATAPPGIKNRTLRQILAFDEANAVALLCLAVEAERTGRYPEAVDHLQKLLQADPEHGEARLRLAVNLRRLGKGRDADRLLAGLVQAPEPEPWVLALACHELARARIAAGQLDEAEKLLLDSQKRLPGDEKLILQLAQLYDLRGDPTRARQALARFKPGSSTQPGDSSEAARHRYNQPPFDLLDQTRKELEESVPEHLPALAVALGSSAARSGS